MSKYIVCSSCQSLYDYKDWYDKSGTRLLIRCSAGRRTYIVGARWNSWTTDWDRLSSHRI